MTTNDLKKGDNIQLRNGWFGIIMDNKKGNTRVVKVFGDFTEIGSVYSHDIIKMQSDEKSNTWVDIQHTDKQLKLLKELNN